MAAPEPPIPYQVVISGAVQQHLLALSEEAIARGDGPAFAAALKDFLARLAVYPQFGDPQIDLTAVPGVIYLGIIRPISMRYAVYEERRLVFVGSPPTLLPMAKPDSPAEG
jgi:hypothetical protein